MSVGECGNLCKFRVRLFRLTLGAADSMLVIDLRKIKTCSPLICIICPVCLVKGFIQREAFHSHSLQRRQQEAASQSALLTLTDAFGCLSVCLSLWVCICV